MSERIIEVKDIMNLHIFNCEKCGKKIMESIECDDGWYEEPDWIEESIFVYGNKNRYIYQTGYLCEKCLKDSTDEFVIKLLNIGFKEKENETTK